MDAIKKKMQAMKLEKDNAMDRADACEQQAKDANLRAERVSEEKTGVNHFHNLLIIHLQESILYFLHDWTKIIFYMPTRHLFVIVSSLLLKLFCNNKNGYLSFVMHETKQSYSTFFFCQLCINHFFLEYLSHAATLVRAFLWHFPKFHGKVLSRGVSIVNCMMT
jgi:hypothetical protein